MTGRLIYSLKQQCLIVGVINPGQRCLGLCAIVIFIQYQIDLLAKGVQNHAVIGAERILKFLN